MRSFGFPRPALRSALHRPTRETCTPIGAEADDIGEAIAIHICDFGADTGPCWSSLWAGAEGGRRRHRVSVEAKGDRDDIERRGFRSRAVGEVDLIGERDGRTIVVRGRVVQVPLWLSTSVPRPLEIARPAATGEGPAKRERSACVISLAPLFWSTGSEHGRSRRANVDFQGVRIARHSTLCPAITSKVAVLKLPRNCRSIRRRWSEWPAFPDGRRRNRRSWSPNSRRPLSV